MKINILSKCLEDSIKKTGRSLYSLHMQRLLLNIWGTAKQVEARI